MSDNSDQAPWSGSVLAGVGLAAKVRIPVPGTNGLCIQFDAPGNFDKSTSTLFFVQDPSAQHGRQLRLDYGPRPTTVKGQKVTVIDYHWNQSKAYADFGIADHSPANRLARGLYQFSKYFKYAGRFLLIVGLTRDAVSIVQADKPLRRATEVTAGWAGAWLGCEVVGEAGAAGGLALGTAVPGIGNAAGAAIGGIGGCIVGGAVGYWASSTSASIAYDWAENTHFALLLEASEVEVRLWLASQGLNAF